MYICIYRDIIYIYISFAWHPFGWTIHACGPTHDGPGGARGPGGEGRKIYQNKHKVYINTLNILLHRYSSVWSFLHDTCCFCITCDIFLKHKRDFILNSQDWIVPNTLLIYIYIYIYMAVSQNPLWKEGRGHMVWKNLWKNTSRDLWKEGMEKGMEQIGPGAYGKRYDPGKCAACWVSNISVTVLHNQT